MNLDSAWQFQLPADMSPALENYYQRALERFSARPAQSGSRARAVIPKLSSRVIIDGKEFTDAEAMPPSYRALYDEILAAAVPLDGAIYEVARKEHSIFIQRVVALGVIALGVAGAIVYLWLRGYYA